MSFYTCLKKILKGKVDFIPGRGSHIKRMGLLVGKFEKKNPRAKLSFSSNKENCSIKMIVIYLM